MTPKERFYVGAFFALTGIAMIILSVYSGNPDLVSVGGSLGFVVAFAGFVVLHVNMEVLKRPHQT